MPKDKALINRMGFNNDGVEMIAERLRQWSMVNGQSSMVNGEWLMVNGEWSMVNVPLSPTCPPLSA